jgi:predicted nucleic acid-binding Zn ribbon protein
MDGCLNCEDALTCDECRFGYKSNKREICTFDLLMVAIFAVLVIMATVTLSYFTLSCWNSLVRRLRKKIPKVEEKAPEPIVPKLREEFEKSYQNVLMSEESE